MTTFKSPSGRFRIPTLSTTVRVTELEFELKVNDGKASNYDRVKLRICPPHTSPSIGGEKYFADISQGKCDYLIDVRATYASTEKAPEFLKSHLFIVYTDEDGGEFIYRGGPEKLSLIPFPGVIETRTREDYQPGTIDWDTKAPSVTVLQGNEVTPDIIRCLDSVSQQIENEKINYDLLGPNSNSVVFTLLQDCVIPIKKPATPFNIFGFTELPGHEFPEALK